MDEAGNLKYFIIENDSHVCEGIMARMQQFPEWLSLGYSTGVVRGIEICTSERPHLLFMDWSLAGGSAFEVLDAIRGLPDYQPYIVCFTGYQGDNPDIPMTLVNRYQIDKYLIKPIWAQLREHLPQFLEHARARHRQVATDAPTHQIWLKDIRNAHHYVRMEQFAAASTWPEDPRCKLLYFFDKKEPVCVRKSWQEILKLLEAQHIDHFMPNARTQLVARTFIERYQAPNIFIKGMPCRFEVVSERAKAFEAWLCRE